MEAITNGRIEAVGLLLDKGADLNVRDGLGETALFRAIRGGRTEAVKLLLDRGADVNVRVKAGTPLKLAEKEGLKEIVELLRAHGAKE